MSRKAKQAAQKILERFGDTLPIKLDAILKEHNISVRKEKLEDKTSGMLVIKDSYAIIGINDNHHPNRQRFTIAHELGHFLLHHTVSNVFIDSSLVFFRDEKASEGTKRQEIEANTFAAELLMPESVLIEKVRNLPPDDDKAVKELADEFAVSVQALTIRLTKLGLITA
ncbi:ImmA/IrrE family metallo-endopeptidase [Anabaena sp. UHCC 0451]|uniref:ImmA/IrrE family metallo-endopeptidase n=1 Tax=Anabaena sp. UHCC 0451 TaxID=2055235 RepID=UPI002B1F682C|nr:ImmA/IrrE family metallo-endopeptidase [Anabaena sp. UHCC 0451]MEA5576070.1 ImmA/IrrE family metallo-endopeptidase [Anabaena sp. UHCC 0451]